MAPQYTIDVIVDLQNDFITGALGTAEAQAIVERAAETAARAAGFTKIESRTEQLCSGTQDILVIRK